MPVGERKRPNIILLVADDHRLQSIGGYGDRQVRTPNLDEMMREGTSFHRTYTMGGTVAAVCVPARAALHTGVGWFRASRDYRSDIIEEQIAISPELPTLGAVLGQAGYRTFATGKWHNDKSSFAASFQDAAGIFFGGDGDPMQLPVHDFDPVGAYPDEKAYVDGRFSTDLFADKAIECLRSHAANSARDPLFLYVAFTSPHDPRSAPEPFGSSYSPNDIVLTDNAWPAHPFDNGELEIRDERLEAWPRKSANIRRHIVDYYGMISHMDARIGDIVRTVRETGLEDDTVMIYTSDHGLALGQHGLMGKQNLYEHSVLVPLIAKGPDIPCGRNIDALAQQYDLFPTICELAGVSVPKGVDGMSLIPHFVGGNAVPGRTEVGAVYRDLQRMICDGKWKLIRYYRADGDCAGTECLQLFDLENDPLELCNLAYLSEYAGCVAALIAKLEAWMLCHGDPMSQGHASDTNGGCPDCA